MTPSTKSPQSTSPTPAEPDYSQLPSCGDFDIRIAADGTWFYRESPIGRKPLVKLFSTVLRREPDGSYWLVTPVERGQVIVDDAPFVAIRMTSEGQGKARQVTLTTNVDAEVPLDADHPLRLTIADDGEPRPYVRVRAELDALILRSVYYHLIELGEFEQIDGVEKFGLWSGGIFHELGQLD